MVDSVLGFWFDELTPASWFVANAEVDRAIGQRFGDVHALLATGLPAGWPATARGQLAAVIALDQFPRNMFRGTAQAFATDASALRIAEAAIDAGLDRQLAAVQRQFLYLPFQHSEKASDQDRSIALYAALDNAQALDFARRHKAIIDRFGRFPHRNRALGRPSTAEEAAFLALPGSSF
jgi:uncharacterized protein (DUF924 family)